MNIWANSASCRAISCNSCKLNVNVNLVFLIKMSGVHLWGLKKHVEYICKTFFGMFWSLLWIYNTTEINIYTDLTVDSFIQTFSSVIFSGLSIQLQCIRRWFWKAVLFLQAVSNKQNSINLQTYKNLDTIYLYGWCQENWEIMNFSNNLGELSL